MNSSDKKTLAKELGVQAGLALPGVPNDGIENQSVVIGVLVDREESTELVKIEVINREKEQRSDRVPFAIQLEEVSFITVDLSFRDIRPLGGVSPVDLRVEVDSTELSIINVRRSIKGRPIVPLNAISRHLPHSVSRSRREGRVSDRRVQESGLSNMVDVGLRRHDAISSRNTGRIIKNLLKVIHTAFESRESKLSRAELIESATKLAAGTTPQASSDVAKSIESSEMGALCRGETRSYSGSRGTLSRVTQAKPVECTDRIVTQVPSRSSPSESLSASRRLWPSRDL